VGMDDEEEKSQHMIKILQTSQMDVQMAAG
jgi:hypothetical protein